MKTCRKCDVEKPLTSFHVNNRNDDKRENTCAQCKNAANKAHNKANNKKPDGKSKWVGQTDGLKPFLYGGPR